VGEIQLTGAVDGFFRNGESKGVVFMRERSRPDAAGQVTLFFSKQQD